MDADGRLLLHPVASDVVRTASISSPNVSGLMKATPPRAMC